MGKGIVFGLILAGICMVSGCQEIEKGDMVSATGISVLGLDAVRCIGSIAETVELECCARQIEKIISFERFLYGYSCVPREKQKKETDIYYDSAERKIYFCTEGSRFLYDAHRLSGYDRYGISRIEMSCNIAMELGSPSCKWIGRTVVDYGVEKKYQLPELSIDDYVWIDEVMEEIEIQFAKRQEQFHYDIYLGDFLRGDEEETEGVIVALAAVGDGKFYVRAKIVRRQDGYDIWMYPSPFGRPGVLEESQSHDKQIENILELDKLVGHIER